MRPRKGNGAPSTSTSVWSDEGTAVPRHGGGDDGYRYNDEDNHELKGNGVKEGKLIDYDDEPQPHQREMAPGDKLRDLLRQMDEEVRRAAPREPRETTVPYQWTGYTRPRQFQPDTRDEETEDEEKPDEGPEEEREEASPARSSFVSEHEGPPTPPPRFGNPYSRRSERRGSPAFAQGRLPSRAAVLLQSGLFFCL